MELRFSMTWFNLFFPEAWIIDYSIEKLEFDYVWDSREICLPFRGLDRIDRKII